jgi:hypothetical protein
MHRDGPRKRYRLVIGLLLAIIGHLSGVSYRYRFFNFENIGFGPTLRTAQLPPVSMTMHSYGGIRVFS